MVVHCMSFTEQRLFFLICRHLNRMAVYHFFGWLWMMNFVIALGECVLAGAFASWYFAFHKPDVSILQLYCPLLSYDEA